MITESAAQKLAEELFATYLDMGMADQEIINRAAIIIRLAVMADEMERKIKEEA